MQLEDEFGAVASVEMNTEPGSSNAAAGRVIASARGTVAATVTRVATRRGFMMSPSKGGRRDPNRLSRTSMPTNL